MATATHPTVAVPDPEGPTSGISDPPSIVLQGIPWRVYLALRAVDENHNLRMTFHDGTLELMAPTLYHEASAGRLGFFVKIVAMELGISCTSSRSTTLQRKAPGQRRTKGSGKEPDESFYFANEPAIRDKRDLDLTVDPPPDLAIEVENTADLLGKLAIYARLGVPELWRYDAVTDSIWFGQLRADGTYAPIGRSLSLPILTPALVIEGLRLGVGLSETQWGLRLRDWIRDSLGPITVPEIAP